LEWLHAQQDPVKLYWAGRDDQLEIAGVGCADRVSSIDSSDYAALLHRLRATISAGRGDARYFGGIRFDADGKRSEEWSSFGSYHFWLPRFEVHTDPSGSELVCNLAFPDDLGSLDGVVSSLFDLRWPTGLKPLLVRAASRRDTPDRASWAINVRRALDLFKQSELEKVVLARRTLIECEERPDPTTLLGQLRRATHEAFFFLFQPQDQVAFVGASPERLYSRSGRFVTSEAVAGTRARGRTQETDARTARELLASPKDRLEHEFVRQSISAALGPLCTTFHQDDSLSVMTLGSRMHLLSHMWGTLGHGVSDAELLRVLHPTPAVGGHPTRRAMRTIGAMEGFDRGWYAGPVGWIGADAAEFAVGIRSGIVANDRIALFSGAGIVEGSTPEGEWQEIEQKMSDFTKLLIDS
jgi:menaquinone-specific isochorismate synthase